MTVVSAVRLWRLVVANNIPGLDPTCKLRKHLLPDCVPGLIDILRSGIETDAALYAVVELCRWSVVASIPALRALVTKISRERSCKSSGQQSTSKYNYNYNNNSTIGRMQARFLHSLSRGGSRSQRLDDSIDEGAYHAHLKDMRGTGDKSDKAGIRTSVRPVQQKAGWLPSETESGLPEDEEMGELISENGGIGLERGFGFGHDASDRSAV